MLTWVRFLLLFLLALAGATAGDDATVLLSFKSSMEKDPKGALATWNQESNSTGHCSWDGVTCSARGRVTGLDLSGGGVVGRLRLGQLAAIETLASVKLSGNSFYGNVTGAGEDGGFPASCGGIEELDLSLNDFGEEIPATAFASCSRLSSIDLSGNRIPGDSLLRAAFSGCRSLVAVNFSVYRLSGSLDGISFSACRSLQSVDISSNSLSGEIPSRFFSNLPPSLAQLRLSHNNFSGHFLAFDLGVCVNLTVLDLSQNSLGGRRGFPASIAKCSKLETIDISKNSYFSFFLVFFFIL